MYSWFPFLSVKIHWNSTLFFLIVQTKARFLLSKHSSQCQTFWNCHSYIYAVSFTCCASACTALSPLRLCSCSLEISACVDPSLPNTCCFIDTYSPHFYVLFSWFWKHIYFKRRLSLSFNCLWAAMHQPPFCKFWLQIPNIKYTFNKF